MREKCRSCGADIRWVATEKSMRWMPVDYDPSPHGNLIVTKDTAAKCYTSRVANATDDAQYPKWISHFATCPSAPQHRRKGNS